MSDDQLMARAKKFFDGKSNLKGEDADPEMQRYMQKLSTNVKSAREDREFRSSLVRTLAVLERDIKGRQDKLGQKFISDNHRAGTKVSSEDMNNQVLRAIPRELRYMHASGLSLVSALNGNSKMTEKELRKFNDRLEGFSSMVDKLRTEGPKGSGYAQEKLEGLSLTDRLRQHKEGTLLDGKRHEELLETLQTTGKQAEERDHKDRDSVKIGLTALLGPAAPLFQLWYDAKEDFKKVKEDGKDLLDTTKKKFGWDREKDEEETRDDRKKTSLFERMLKAMRLQELGRKGRGLFGSLFGDNDTGGGRGRRGGRGAPGGPGGGGRAGKTPGRTGGGRLGRLGGAMGRAGGAVATGARAAWGLAGGAAAGLGAAGLVAGAGYLGYKAGEYINDNLLTDDQKRAVGDAIGGTVDYITGNVKSAGTAILSAGAGVANFFSKAYEDTADKLKDAGKLLGDWSKDAKEKLADFWDSMKGGAKGAVNTVVRNVKDFISPQAGGANIADSEKSLGERARASLEQSLDKGRSLAGMQNTSQKQRIAALQTQMTAAGIVDPTERAMFMAQMHHESGGFKAREESFRYRDAGRIADVSGTAKRAGPEAIKAAMAKGPEAVAELMYGGRKDLGNTEQGDGWKFRGRGDTQLTGRANYARYGAKIGVDLVSNPDLAMEPDVAAKLAVEYWKDRKLGGAARAGDVTSVTQGLNGGQNGAEDRASLFRYYQSQGPDQGMALASQTSGGSSFSQASLRRMDMASAKPAGTGGYERVPATSMGPQMIEQQAVNSNNNVTSTGSTAKVGMQNDDFYVDDLAMIVMNRGYTG